MQAIHFLSLWSNKKLLLKIETKNTRIEKRKIFLKIFSFCFSQTPNFFSSRLSSKTLVLPACWQVRFHEPFSFPSTFKLTAKAFHFFRFLCSLLLFSEAVFCSTKATKSEFLAFLLPDEAFWSNSFRI